MEKKTQIEKPEEEETRGRSGEAAEHTEEELQDREVGAQRDEESVTPVEPPRRSTRPKTWEVKYTSEDSRIQVEFPVAATTTTRKFPDIPEEDYAEVADPERPVHEHRRQFRALFDEERETADKDAQLRQQSEGRRLRKEVERFKESTLKTLGTTGPEYLYTPIREYHLPTPARGATATTGTPAAYSTPSGPQTEKTQRYVHPIQQTTTEQSAGHSREPQARTTEQPTPGYQATQREDSFREGSANLNWKESRSRDDDSYHLSPTEGMSSGTGATNATQSGEQGPRVTRALPVRTIPVAEQYLIFRGDAHAEETHFVPGPSVDRWIESANNYFTSAEITDDVERIRRLASFVDPLMGNARLIVKQKAECKLKKQESYRQFCDGIRAFYSTKVEKDYFLQVRRWFMAKPPMNGVGDLTNAISQAVEMSADMLSAYSSLGVTAKYQLWEEMSNEVRKGIQEFILITTLTSLLPSRLCEEAIWKEDLDTDPDTMSENVILHARKTLKDHEVEARSKLMEIPQPTGYFIVPDQLFPKKRTHGRINQISDTSADDLHYEERLVQRGERRTRVDEEYDNNGSEAGGINAYKQKQLPDRRENFQKTSYGRGRGRADPTDRTSGRGRRPQSTSAPNRSNVCFICLKIGHRFTNCRDKPPAPRGLDPKSGDWCRGCYGSGHRAYHHADMLPDPGPLSPENECTRCRGRGHLRQYCPNILLDGPTDNGKKSQDFRHAQSTGRGG